MAVTAAAYTAITVELQALANHRRPSITEVATTSRLAVTRAQMLSRPRLKNAAHGGIAKYLPKPEDCQHPEVFARGSRHGYWWTCKTCPARWPRSQQEYLANDQP
eukprot:6459102-Amphidinium_carterae.2